MSAHPIQWQAPEPLWSRFGGAPEAAAVAADQFRPAILRFATDDFMEQMIATLARDPAQIGGLLARPETWRAPPAGSPAPDMAERVALPRIVQAAARRFALGRPKSSLEAVGQTAPAKEKTQTRTLPLKLYQPAHQRFYLVGASLVCRALGQPDRNVAQDGPARMGFVLRRMLPAKAGEAAPLREFAFAQDADGARWRQVAGNPEDEGRLLPGEEMLPVFPLGYRDALGHARTLWAGLVPVGRREEYLGSKVDRSPAPSLAEAQIQSLSPRPPAPPAEGVTARMTQFKMEVAEPWKSLVRASHAAHDSLAQPNPPGMSDSEPPGAKYQRAFALNLQWQMQSWLVLLDFADFLAVHLPEVWNAVANGASPPGPPSSPGRALHGWLAAAAMSPALVAALRRPGAPNDIKPPAASLGAALAAAAAARAGLERTAKLYGDATTGDPDWPGFHFLLAGLDTALAPAGPYQNLPPPDAAADVGSAPSASANPALAAGNAAAESLDRLTALVVRALEVKPETDAPPPPFALQLSRTLKDNAGDEGWFVARHVHLPGACGPLQPATLSAPSQRFQLASFFDADAPARPIQISLPLDTTPAGLRKHGKNTAFVVSDVLCGQIQRAKGLGLVDLVRSVLPWPLHKDLDLGDGGPCESGGLNIGMVCSLSIPIITLCALILLIIIVLLLDFVFRWLPYFIICFPVPGLSGKPKESP